MASAIFKLDHTLGEVFKFSCTRGQNLPMNSGPEDLVELLQDSSLTPKIYSGTMRHERYRL